MAEHSNDLNFCEARPTQTQSSSRFIEDLHSAKELSFPKKESKSAHASESRKAESRKAELPELKLIAPERLPAGTAVDLASFALTNLPEHLDAEISKEHLKLSTDFGKLSTALTGASESDLPKVISSIKSVSLDQRRISLELKEPYEMKAPPMHGLEKLAPSLTLGADGGKVSFDLQTDGDTIKLTKAKGLCLHVPGIPFVSPRDIQIDSVTIDASKQPATLSFSADGGKQIELPGAAALAEALIDAKQIKALGAGIQDLEKHNLDPLLSGIKDAGMRAHLNDFLQSISQVHLDGKSLQIERNENSKIELGSGGSIELAKELSCRLPAKAERPIISEIKGVDLTIPLSDVLGGPQNPKLDTISLGKKDADGDRKLTVLMREPKELGSCTIDRDLNFVPGKGLYIVITNPRATGNDNQIGFDLHYDKNGKCLNKQSEFQDAVTTFCRQASSYDNVGVLFGLGAAASSVDAWTLRLFGQ